MARRVERAGSGIDKATREEVLRQFYPGTQQQHHIKSRAAMRGMDTRTLSEALLAQMRLEYLDDPEVSAEYLGRRFGCSSFVAQRYLDRLESEPFIYD